MKQRPVFGLYEISTHIALKQKDYKAAIRYGEKALELEKSRGFKFHVLLHLNMASAYAQTQQTEAAAGQLEQILEFTQNDPVTFRARRTQVHNQLAVLRFKQKKCELAKRACKLTQSKKAMHLNTLTVAYFTVKNYSEAVKTSEKALVLVRAEGDQAIVAKMEQQLNQIKRELARSK